MKKALFLLILLCNIIFLKAQEEVIYNSPAPIESYKVVVINEDAELREKPNLNSKIITTIRNENSVKAFEKIEEFTRVKFLNEEGYNIVKAILYDTVDISRVVDRDTNSYFGILFDDNNRKPICRLYFNSDNVRYIATFCKDKVETKNKIESLSDIYKYSNEIRNVVKSYLEL